ncbi:hypothetical protein ACU4GD_33690 [Cupriavidus basilensis]
MIKTQRMPILPMLILLVLLATPLAARAWERGKVETFATLPPGEAHPEGIAVDREGNVYIVTVAVEKPRTSEGALLDVRPAGQAPAHCQHQGLEPNVA